MTVYYINIEKAEGTVRGRLNTETSELILADCNGVGRSDFRYTYESLYRTKAGQFWMEGEGGPMSGYARHSSDGTSTGGSGARLLTNEEAYDWARRKGLIDNENEAIFGIKVKEL